VQNMETRRYPSSLLVFLRTIYIFVELYGIGGQLSRIYLVLYVLGLAFFGRSPQLSYFGFRELSDIAYSLPNRNG
jgi:hypothetical protein